MMGCTSSGVNKEGQQMPMPAAWVPKHPQAKFGYANTWATVLQNARLKSRIAMNTSGRAVAVTAVDAGMHIKVTSMCNTVFADHMLCTYWPQCIYSGDSILLSQGVHCHQK